MFWQRVPTSPNMLIEERGRENISYYGKGRTNKGLAGTPVEVGQSCVLLQLTKALWCFLSSSQIKTFDYGQCLHFPSTCLSTGGTVGR